MRASCAAPSVFCGHDEINVKETGFTCMTVPGHTYLNVRDYTLKILAVAVVVLGTSRSVESKG